MTGSDYIKIYGWMRSELGLKGNELMVFALIHSHSVNGGCGCYASLKHYMDWTGASRQTIITVLKTLEEKKLVKKIGKKASTNIYVSLINIAVSVEVKKRKTAKKSTQTKTKKEPSGPDEDVQKVLDVWKQAADRLKEEGKINAVITDGLEAVKKKIRYKINTYGIDSVLEMLLKASADDFCINKAGFSLPVLMNSTVFSQTLNKQTKPKIYESMKPRKTTEELAAALGISKEKYLEDLRDGKIYDGRYLIFS